MNNKILIWTLTLLMLSSAVFAATAKHSYTITSEGHSFADEKTMFSGVFCSDDSTYTSRSYVEFDPQELNNLPSGNAYLVLQVSQLAKNICQSKNDMEFLEIFPVANLPDDYKITWDNQPTLTSSIPIDSRQFLSNSIYRFKIPSHVLDSMKDYNRALFQIRAAGDTNLEFASAKEMRKRARIEVVSSPYVFDTDNDGLEDVVEAQIGSDIADADSDDDGVLDFVEVLQNLDPIKKDSLGDGIPDKDRIKENACQKVRCPMGVECSEGACLVESLKDSVILEKFKERNPTKPAECLKRGGELCELSYECDGSWAPSVSDNCCFGVCKVPQDCIINSVSFSSPDAYQGDKITITAQGTFCDGKIARIQITEMDGIGSNDEILSTPLPVKFENGIAKATWLAEWQDDGVFGGDPEFQVCLKAEDAKKCAKDYLKVKKKIGPTCAAGDGCRGECSESGGDPDCGCPDLLPNVESYVCTREDECENPIISADGICCVEPCGGACTDIWDPVCGKDGETYSNACYAKQAGVMIDYEGECSSNMNGSNSPCYDSDGHLGDEQIMIKGYVDSDGLTFEDQCVSTGLKEYTCVGSTVHDEYFDCDCDTGKCIVSDNSSCSDSDGSSLTTKGSCVDEYGSHVDFCLSDLIVFEYSCDGAYCTNETHNCSLEGFDACVGGVCVYTGVNHSIPVHGELCDEQCDSGLSCKSNPFSNNKFCCSSTECSINPDGCLISGSTAGDYVCDSGVWTEQSGSNSSCTDSDGGLNIWVRGTVDDGQAEYRDSCTSDISLHEWFCNPSNAAESEDFTCTISCSNGICTNSTTNQSG